MTTKIVTVAVTFKTCSFSGINFLIAMLISHSSRIHYLATSLMCKTKYRNRNQVKEEKPGETEIDIT